METGSVSPISTGFKMPGQAFKIGFIIRLEKNQQVALTRQFSHPAYQLICQQEYYGALAQGQQSQLLCRDV